MEACIAEGTDRRIDTNMNTVDLCQYFRDEIVLLLSSWLKEQPLFHRLAIRKVFRVVICVSEIVHDFNIWYEIWSKNDA